MLIVTQLHCSDTVHQKGHIKKGLFKEIWTGSFCLSDLGRAVGLVQYVLNKTGENDKLEQKQKLTSQHSRAYW